MYGYACCYTPDPDRPGKGLVPFELDTGRLIDELWERWLALDPVRMAPAHADELRSMRRVYLDAGRGDEARSWFRESAQERFTPKAAAWIALCATPMTTAVHPGKTSAGKKPR